MSIFHDHRLQYGKYRLEKDTLHSDPIIMFEEWFHEVVKAELPDANAMVVATCHQGRPSARITLLKEISEGGFVFFTNYHSRKGREIALNPHVSLLFYWQAFERQVRIEGIASQISHSESDQYFNSRPFESRLAAIVSPQSEVIESKNLLVEQYNQMLTQSQHAPRPDHWGGFRVIPEYFEFWQGGENRLHDRFTYRLENKKWVIHQLAP